VDAEVISVRHQTLVRRTAIVVAAGFAGLVLFQLALAAGAPLGAAAWGGAEAVLPATLRIGSALAVLLYAVGAFAVLRCAGFTIGWMPQRFARVATWVFGVVLPLSALANAASTSEWERFLLAPLGLMLGVLCLAIARYSRAPTDDSAIGARQRGVVTLDSMDHRPADERPPEKRIRSQGTRGLDEGSALTRSGDSAPGGRR
jgi:hypothetical protein